VRFLSQGVQAILPPYLVGSYSFRGVLPVIRSRDGALGDLMLVAYGCPLLTICCLVPYIQPEPTNQLSRAI